MKWFHIVSLQASNHSLHRGEHSMDPTYHLGDLNTDALFPSAIEDGIGDDIGCEMDDLLSIFINPMNDDKNSASGSLIHGDEGCQSPSKMGVPSAVSICSSSVLSGALLNVNMLELDFLIPSFYRPCLSKPFNVRLFCFSFSSVLAKPFTSKVSCFKLRNMEWNFWKLKPWCS